MLPIKRKHYNLLTGQFEDECRNNFNLLPTTSYPTLVSETNENDVEIARIKADAMICFDKIQAKNKILLAAADNLKEAIVSDPTRRRYKCSNYERGWFGMVETFRMVIEKD